MKNNYLWRLHLKVVTFRSFRRFNVSSAFICLFCFQESLIPLCYPVPGCHFLKFLLARLPHPAPTSTLPASFRPPVVLKALTSLDQEAKLLDLSYLPPPTQGHASCFRESQWPSQSQNVWRYGRIQRRFMAYSKQEVSPRDPRLNNLIFLWPPFIPRVLLSTHWVGTLVVFGSALGLRSKLPSSLPSSDAFRAGSRARGSEWSRDQAYLSMTIELPRSLFLGRACLYRLWRAYANHLLEKFLERRDSCCS